MLPWSSQMSGETQAGRYRLVAVDLDGSLQPNGALHEADAAALRTAHAAGVKVVLVSALPPQIMHRYWAQLGLGVADHRAQRRAGLRFSQPQAGRRPAAGA